LITGRKAIGLVNRVTDIELFDEWPARYEEWFSTPIGRLVKKTECALVLEMLSPAKGEKILDAGCGTGIFTLDYLAAGAEVVGLDISGSMLAAATRKATGYPFTATQGDMVDLPFEDETFDKAVSVTALEFIEDGKRAVDELFRVTKTGGLVVVGTLNSLSPWAARRRAKTEHGQRHILEGAFFRSPSELLACSPVKGTAKTVVYFQKNDPLEKAVEAERLGQSQSLDTGAFVAARWVNTDAQV
jgi:ubiquinone/menaquinone biosynthesis C-methylase UbiE